MAAFPTAAASIVLVLLVPLHADAQYRTSDLTPPKLPAGVGAHIQGVDDAGAHAIGSLMQGTATFRGAVLWDLNAGAHTLLNPAGHTKSLGWGVHGGQQVGWAQQSATNQLHAALWNGSASSFVDINPKGAHLSGAYDTSGLYHVGNASFDGAINRAILWEQRGGAHFWRDMTPPGRGGGDRRHRRVSTDRRRRRRRHRPRLPLGTDPRVGHRPPPRRQSPLRPLRRS